MRGAAAFLAGFMLLLATPTQAVTGRGKPGYCGNDGECEKRSPGYSCVAVQTTRQNIESVQQCLPRTNASMPICMGDTPGLCPSFSTTWGTVFREIASVCAYIVPSLNNKCILPGETRKSKSDIKCLFIEDPTNKTSSGNKRLGVIYGCVDFDGRRLLFKPDDRSDRLQRYFHYNKTVVEGCVNPKNPSGSGFVCSSQGTCAPEKAGSMDKLSCRCNVGFSGKYCEKIVDNQCYNDGVCGGGSCDLTTMECTKCRIGTTGNKCAECVPGANNTCSKHGTCVPASGDSTLGAGASGETSSGATTISGSSSTGSRGGSNGMDDTVGDETSKTNKSRNATAKATRGVVMPAAYRKLESSHYQCQCYDGYSDVHCGVHVGKKANSSSSATAAPQQASQAAAHVTLSMTTLAIVAASVWAM